MDGGFFTTPAETTGMGNPMAPDEVSGIGSGDTFISPVKKHIKRKMQSLKDYVKTKLSKK